MSYPHPPLDECNAVSGHNDHAGCSMYGVIALAVAVLIAVLR
jgi:hypothetical protein